MLIAILLISTINLILLCAFLVLTLTYCKNKLASPDELYSRVINDLIPRQQEDTGILIPLDDKPEDKE